MINSLRQGAWRRLSLIFPERQVYIRGDGQVRFLTFSSQMQAMFVAIGLLFLGWVAFTSINVIFKDRILQAKERHFLQMQASYESRLADLQLSYDELNSALVTAQDRFKAVADSFSAKQEVLAAVLDRKRSVLGSLAIGMPPSQVPAINLRPSTFPPNGSGRGMGGAFDAISPGATGALPPPFAAEAGFLQNLGQPTPSLPQAMPAPQPDSVRAAGPTGFFRGAVGRLGNFFRRKVSIDQDEHPVVKEAAAQSARIVRLELGEPALLAEAAQDVDRETSRLTQALKATGIDVKTLMKRVSEGKDHGPPLAIESAETGSGEESFIASMQEAGAAVEKLDTVVMVLNRLPLVGPSEMGEVSSGFGERTDPFNEELAFHSGVDFSGPMGSDVRATAGGIVVFAGPRGAYGNTVEIDHGYGIRTRYGHLSRIVAQMGSRLEKGAIVGRLGSTGRSTGPHVHYEVWYDEAVRDPSKFIKAGNYVLKE